MGNENQGMSENIHGKFSEANLMQDINYQEIFKKYSPYKILGVAENESIENILLTYRKLLKKHHPDKGGEIKKFNLIKEAFAEINIRQESKQYIELKKNFQKDCSNKLQKKNVPSQGLLKTLESEDFIEKFNKNFEKNYLKDEFENNGYACPDWDTYDKKINENNKNNNFEIIPYEEISYVLSNDTCAQPLENERVTDFNKYPTLNEKNLNYTDFYQAYTTNSCLLPDDHNKIWNEHFQDYHHRDLKKMKNDRETKLKLEQHELQRHEERTKREKDIETQKKINWNKWIETQESHYKQVNLLE
jgi:hypothetical protein